MNAPLRSLIRTTFFILAIPLLSSASAAKDGDVIVRGRCADGVKTKLKASPENRRIELEYEIDQARAGERWKIVIRKNGRIISRKVRRASKLGNVEIRKLISNGSGRESIRVVGKNLRTGRKCSLSLEVPF